MVRDVRFHTIRKAEVHFSELYCRLPAEKDFTSKLRSKQMKNSLIFKQVQTFPILKIPYSCIFSSFNSLKGYINLKMCCDLIGNGTLILYSSVQDTDKYNTAVLMGQSNCLEVIYTNV
jgi:hypothetical protein